MAEKGVLCHGESKRNVKYSFFFLQKMLILLFFRINLKDIKCFLSRINYKIPTNKLREIFNDVDTRKRGEIGFDDFTVLYQKMIADENVSD